MDIVKQTREYSVADVGQFSNIADYIYQPNPNFKLDGKVFLKEALEMTSAEISFNSMKPDTAINFMHKHKHNEEIYLTIKGTGQLLLDEDLIDLKEGTVVRVNTKVARAIRNNGTSAFIFIVIQAKQDSLEGVTTSDGYVVDEKPNW